jgi:plastocyanin
VRKRLAILLLATLVLSACEGEEAGVDEEAQQDETPAECADVSAPEGAAAPLTMSDNFFDPLCLAMSSTQALSVTNAGNIDHNLTVQGSDLSIDVAPGDEDETSEIGEFLQAGTHRFFCRFHEEEGMVGTIVVE